MRRAGAHRSSPRPQPGRDGRLQAAAGGPAAAGRTASSGRRCHGARAARGARGAGGGGARGGARARAAGLRRRGRRTIASPCRRPPAPAGGPGPSGAGGPAGLGAGPESPPPRLAPWQPRPLLVLGTAPRPGVADLPPGESGGRSVAGSRPPPPSAWVPPIMLPSSQPWAIGYPPQLTGLGLRSLRTPTFVPTPPFLRILYPRDAQYFL